MSSNDSFPLNPITSFFIPHLKRHPKRVVFTDGEDIRIIQAAVKMVNEEIIAPILLGNRERILKLAEEHSLPMRFIKVIEPSKSSDFQLFCKRVVNMARYRSTQVTNPEELVSRPHYFGALMVQYGQADAIVGGNLTQPGYYFRALHHTIKPLPHIPKLFGVTILTSTQLQNFGADGILFLADCGLIPDPSVKELSVIAVETGKLARHLLGRKPNVALLSYSNKGSASTPDSKKIAAATALATEEVQRHFLDIDIDGELQADVALVPAIAQAKMPGHAPRHSADVLVFPNLDAAHISLKLLQHLGGAQDYGQILVGLARPAAQIPNTASVETIFGTACAVAVEAIKFHHMYPDGEV